MSGWPHLYEPWVLAWFNGDRPAATEETIVATLRSMPPLCLPMLVDMEHARLEKE